MRGSTRLIINLYQVQLFNCTLNLIYLLMPHSAGSNMGFIINLRPFLKLALELALVLAIAQELSRDS